MRSQIDTDFSLGLNYVNLRRGSLNPIGEFANGKYHSYLRGGNLYRLDGDDMYDQNDNVLGTIGRYPYSGMVMFMGISPTSNKPRLTGDRFERWLKSSNR